MIEWLRQAYPMKTPAEAIVAPSSGSNDGRTAEDILQFAEEEMIQALVAFSGTAAGQLLELVGLPFVAALRVEAHGGNTTRPLVSPRRIPAGGVLLQPQPPATADTLEATLAARAPNVPWSRQSGLVHVRTPPLTPEGERLLQAGVSAAAAATKAQVRSAGTAANVAADRAAMTDVLSESERDDVKDEIGELMRLYDCLVTEGVRELLSQRMPPDDLKDCADDEEG